MQMLSKIGTKGNWTLLKPLLEKEDYHEPNLVAEKKLDQCLHQLYKNLNKASFSHLKEKLT